MTSRVRPLCFHSYLRRDAATTVLEILAVVTIVIVLFLLVSSAMHRTLEGARAVQCVGNLKQLAAAAIAYASDHNMQLPHASSWPTGRLPHWYEAEGPLAPYLNVPEGRTLGKDFLRCPSAKMPDKQSEFVSYGINYRYVFFVEAYDPTNLERLQVYPGSARLNKIPPNSFLFGDSGIPGFGNQGFIYSPFWWTFDADHDGDGKLDSNGAIGGGPYNWFSPRHNHTGNMALADGSVRTITPEQWATNDDGIWGPDLSNP